MNQFWQENRLICSVDLKALDIHKQIAITTPFKSLVWSCDERYFFYLAERKPAKTKSFFDQKPSKPDDGVVPGNEYKYVEDWGEQLTGYSKTVLAVFDVEEEEVKLVSYDGGEDRCITKVIPDPQDSNVLYMILHNTKPFRLGLIYSTQRASNLIRISGWKNDNPKVTPIVKNDGNAVLDVTVSPDGGRLIWFQCPDGGPLNRAFEMWSCLTVNIEETKYKAVANKFFFDSQLQNVFKTNCWLDNNSVIINPIEKSQSFVQIVNFNTSSIIKVDLPNDNCSSYFVLDMFKNDLLLLKSSFSSPPVLIRAKHKEEYLFLFKEAHPFMADSHYLTAKVGWQLVSTKFDHYDMDYIFAYPKKVANGQKTPLIVIPHGGPHSVFLTAFNELAMDFVLFGYAVILVNYPGSLGFNNLEDLPGKIGILDVQSVHHAVVESLSKFSDKLDKHNVFVYGGSHGGFLALRLIADHSDFYRTCICRNPVSDIVQFTGVADVPDWSFVECGLQPSLRGVVELDRLNDPDVLAKLNEQSPTKFITKMKTPILMLLGSDDRDAPMCQTLWFCKMLKQLKPQLPLEILVYKDNHRLNSTKTHSDLFIKTLQWCERFRKFRL